MKRNALALLSCALFLFVAACSSAVPAETSTRTAEVTTRAQPVQGALADAEIGGYCPVAYVEAGKPLKGSAEFASQRNGRTYWFVNDGARKMYEANPDKYDVAYRGWCATALAMGAGKVTSDPAIFSVHQGRVYLFSNADAKAAFDANASEMVSKADVSWGGIAQK